MLLKKDVPFMFNEKCRPAFKTLKSILIFTLVIITPNWSAPLELMFDVIDYTIRVVLGQRRNKMFHAIYYASKTLLVV